MFITSWRPAVLDSAVAGWSVRVAGDVLMMKQFHVSLERGASRELRIRRLGSVDDLWAEIERRKEMANSPFSSSTATWAGESGTTPWVGPTWIPSMDESRMTADEIVAQEETTRRNN